MQLLSLRQLAVLLSIAPLFSIALPTAPSDEFDPNSEDPHNRVDWKNHPFQKPGPNDSRGPCPGLNSLANHGFLNRNGRNITLGEMITGFKVTMNVSPKLTAIPGKLSMLTSKDPDTIDALESMALHGNIEHDTSFSRKDKFLGNHIVFDEETYQDIVNSSPGKDYYDAESAGRAQKIQLEKGRQNNPHLKNTINEFMVRTRESTFYLSSMGDPVTGRAPKKFVDIMFREERLPLEEGWRVPKNEMSPATDLVLKKTIMQFSEWTPEPGQYPWVVLAPGAPEDPMAAGETGPPVVIPT